MTKLIQCYSCNWIDQDNTIDQSYKCKKQKLSRKKKKRLKNILKYVYLPSESFFQDTISSCTIGNDWKQLKRFESSTLDHKKFSNAIDIIISFEELEPIGIGIDGNFGWVWEDYNGLYTTSGIMPFVYNKIENDDTLSFSETKLFIKELGVTNFNINSDTDLIKAVHYKIERDKSGGFGELPQNIIDMYGNDHKIEFVDARILPILDQLKSNQSLVCGDRKTFYFLLTEL